MPPETVPALQRDADGFPVGIPPRVWRSDPELGTEVFVVNETMYLSYRAESSRPTNPAIEHEGRIHDLYLGFRPWREETAIVRRGRPTLVLLGNHKAELVVAASSGESALRRYYDGSSRHCPRAPRRWNSEDPN